MPSFSGEEQHDAHDFMVMLLDKMSKEYDSKPNVIRELFGGRMMTKLTCNHCGEVKNFEEKFSTLSLPIPESDYNFYSIFIIPINAPYLKKVIFKIHRTATVVVIGL